MENQAFYRDEQNLIQNYFFDYGLNLDHLAITGIRTNRLRFYTLANKTFEFIIRPQCNQKCKYCYITKYGNDLYPLEERLNNEQILSNIQIFLNFLEEHKVLLFDTELFAGDLFYDDLIYPVLEQFYNYYKVIYYKEQSYFYSLKEQNSYLAITIPTNFSFVNNEKHLPLLLKWQEQFEQLQIRLIFSASVDGKYATSVRENKSQQEVDNYYNKIFMAAEALKSGFHPMISFESIETAIENYDWWLEKTKQCDWLKDFSPMTFEVRNDGWTEEKIQIYLNFLNHVLEKRLEMCENDIKKLTYHLFVGDGKNNTLKENSATEVLTNFIKMNDNNLSLKDETSCSLSNTIAINISNMSLVPCHRLTYYQFIGGKFIIENNKIIGIDPINPSGYIGLHTLNFNLQPKCQSCILRYFCVKGCYGSQYETFGDPLMPIESVCNLFFAKHKFLLSKYYELGVLTELFNKKYLPDHILEEIKNLCRYFKIGDY